jgi:hypothetical protein
VFWQPLARRRGEEKAAMIEPFQMYVDVTGTSWVLLKELRGGFFWLGLRVSYVPHLKIFSIGNLRRMQLLGKLRLE